MLAQQGAATFVKSNGKTKLTDNSVEKFETEHLI